MERLTEKISEYIQCNNNECRLSYCDRECEHYKRMINKLAEYEDAEEQGLLLRFPCKVGDTIYCFGCGGEIIEGACKAIQIDERYKMAFIEGKDFCFWKMFEKFSKTVFLTKEEAEKALEQMKVGE